MENIARISNIQVSSFININHYLAKTEASTYLLYGKIYEESMKCSAENLFW